MRRIRSFLVQFSCISAVALCSSQAFADKLATRIADHYVRSFPSEGRGADKEAEKEQADHKIRPAKLEEKAKREVVFNSIFTQSGNYDALEQKMAPILNKYAWSDLKLFYGTTTMPTYHLIGRLNRTVTTLGEGVLATMLVTPTSDIRTLQQRQHIIQTLLNNKEAVGKLKASLGHYQEAEQSMLSLWTPYDPLYTKEYNNYMNNHFYAKDSVSGNKSAGWLEFKKRLWRDFFGIQYQFLWPVTTPILGEIILPGDMLRDQQGGISARAYLWTGAIPYYGEWYQWSVQTKAFRSKGAKPPGILLLMPILQSALYTWTAYTGVSNYLEYSSVLRNLALRMADVQTFVKVAAEVSEYIAANPELEEVYGERLTGLRKLLAQDKEDTELGRLIYYLQNLPYNAWSYFFNNAGRLLASHKLFTEHKDAFADAMYELGALDAYISVATLVQASRDDEAVHKYVFTKFLDRKQRGKPYVKLAEMWNPLLDAAVAVGNSIEMDSAPGGVRNIILTGPNAGGKSTFLTGITTSILLSQTFGIAPAKEIVITPFDKINTYIDIADDIAAGKSLFMAEVDRAQEHLNMLEGLKPAEFSFTIFDEPFSGTNPDEGAAAEYSILEAMAGYTNTLTIVATHYPLVMLLEKNVPDKGFANYKVYITRKGTDRKLNYTYKVVPGKSNQAIAIDILEEEGYDTRLLKRAREIIEHPERYKSSF